MTERISESDYDQLHHFISQSPWDSFSVMDSVSEKVGSTLGLGSPRGLLLDESGWEKSGKKSVGVARQYIGQVGKVANGQVGVFAALCNGEQVGLLQGRLYVPQEWIKDRDRCNQAGIPQAEQVYRTKAALAVEILKTLPKNVGYDWVGGDCIYGNSLGLRQHLYDENQSFVLDVGEELGVYVAYPDLYLPAKKDGRGRTPTNYVCDAKPISIKNVAKQIPEEQWQTIPHRQGTKGPLIRKAVIVEVYICKPERATSIEAIQLLISTDQHGAEIKYSLCFEPSAKMTLQVALFRQMQRYWVERAFQNAKQQLGLHQYQVRSWKAWHHHIALTLMALHFVLQIQKQQAAQMPLLSIPDIKLVFAKKLANKLHSDQGILHALTRRHLKRKVDLDRFSKVPK